MAAWNRLGELPTYALNPNVFKGDKFGGRFLSVPGVTLGTQVGVTNWCADTELLEVVLKRLRRVSQAGEPAFRLAQIPPLIYLERAALLPTLGSDWASLGARVSKLTAALGGNLHALNEMVDLITKLRPVEARPQRGGSAASSRD